MTEPEWVNDPESIALLDAFLKKWDRRVFEGGPITRMLRKNDAERQYAEMAKEEKENRERERAAMIERLSAVFETHMPAGVDHRDRPYKTVCQCGRAAYMFNTHLAEVAVETIHRPAANDSKNALVLEGDDK